MGRAGVKIQKFVDTVRAGISKAAPVVQKIASGIKTGAAVAERIAPLLNAVPEIGPALARGVSAVAKGAGKASDVVGRIAQQVSQYNDQYGAKISSGIGSATKGVDTLRNQVMDLRRRPVGARMNPNNVLMPTSGG